MKTKTLLTKAKKELANVNEERVVELLKTSIKNIAACKKTLKRLEKSHKKLLETDIDDLELEDFEY